MISKTPSPPYYAVIFTSVLNENIHGYESMSNKMIELAQIQDGFLGFESARETVGITISYWDNLEAISKWKNNIDHKLAQKLGREKWYKAYKTRITQIIRDYEFSN